MGMTVQPVSGGQALREVEGLLDRPRFCHLALWLYSMMCEVAGAAHLEAEKVEHEGGSRQW
jgi:hypothetical protein